MGTDDTDTMSTDEAALRAALNVLRDSVEAGRMPSGLPLEPGARDMHEQAIVSLERLLEGAAGVLGAEGSQSTPAVATIAGRKTFEKTRDAYKEAVVQNGNKPLTKSPFDALLAAARMQIQYPDEILPDDFILTCVYPKTKDEKLEVDKLGAIVDSMDRLRVNEETPVSEDTETVLQTAIDALMQRIKDMGGTSAMKKAEEKLKARRA